MPISWAGQDERSDLSEECHNVILKQIAACEAVPMTDEEIRQWSRNAYQLTMQRYLAADLEEHVARQAGAAVALAVVGYVVYCQAQGGRRCADSG